jgi:hypothetical protein
LRKKEVIELERKIKTLIISSVLVLAILSGIAMMVYANAGTSDTNALAATVNGVPADADCSRDFGGYGFGGHHRGGMGGFFAGESGRCGPGGSITVSQEFKDNVINITESDTDVQKLLAEGYNITGVRPLINSTIEADGTVTMKATNAIVTMVQNTTGRAFVWVNVEQAKVTRIEILTMIVIEKP